MNVRKEGSYIMKTIQKLKNWVCDKWTQATLAFTLASIQMQPMLVYADTAGTDKITQFVGAWLAPWLTQIGGIVMLIGGIQFALAWQRQECGPFEHLSLSL